MSSDNVVSLTGGEPPRPPVEANAGIVELLRQALTRAINGEIQNIAIVYTDGDGDVGGTFSGRPSQVLFALARMERRIHKSVGKVEKGP